MNHWKQTNTNNNVFSVINTKDMGKGGKGGSGSCIAVKVMPEPSDSLLGEVRQYIGPDNEYKKGYFYECRKVRPMIPVANVTHFTDDNPYAGHLENVSIDLPLLEEVTGCYSWSECTIKVDIKNISTCFRVNINGRPDFDSYTYDTTDLEFQQAIDYLQTQGITLTYSNYGNGASVKISFSISLIPGDWEYVWEVMQVQPDFGGIQYEIVNAAKNDWSDALQQRVSANIPSGATVLAVTILPETDTSTYSNFWNRWLVHVKENSITGSELTLVATQLPVDDLRLCIMYAL